MRGAQSATAAKALIRIALAMLAGLGATLVFALGVAPTAAIMTIAVGAVVAGASAMTGGLLGFLFGIPRALRDAEGSAASGGTGDASAEADASERRRTYEGNTNLEQISDWLTKILVGVGLTQIGDLPQRFNDLGAYLAPAFASSATFAVGLVVYFVIAGFLFGYLWTRLYMIEALRQADALIVLSRLQEESDADGRALALVREQLAPGAGAVADAELRAVIARASTQVRSMIRDQAYTAQRAERAVPILRALVDTGEDADDHARLAYKLKDQQVPDFAGAEKELTIAINKRGPMDANFGWYEYTRAVCRLSQEDPTKPSTNKDAILRDLRAGARDPSVAAELQRNDAVTDWLKKNRLSSADVMPPAPAGPPSPPPKNP